MTLGDWRRELEPLLTAAEIQWMSEHLATMSRERQGLLLQLSPEDAAANLRFDMRMDRLKRGERLDDDDDAELLRRTGRPK